MYLINISPNQIPELEEFINLFSHQLNKLSVKKNLSAFKKRDYFAQTLRYKSYSDLLNKSKEFALKAPREDFLSELSKCEGILTTLEAKYSTELGYDREIVLSCYSKTVTTMALRTALKAILPNIATELENSNDPNIKAMTSLLNDSSIALSHVDEVARGRKSKPEILVRYPTDGLNENSSIHDIIGSKEYKALKEHRHQGVDFFVYTSPDESLSVNDTVHIEVRGSISKELSTLVANLKNSIDQLP